jgi:hypothetical protein
LRQIIKKISEIEMPIETTRIENGIYLNRWIGAVTMEDVLQSEQRGIKMIGADEPRVVLVNDLSEVSKMPLDTKALRRVVENNPQVIGLLIVNAPVLLRMAGEAQAKKVSWIVEFFDVLDSAYARARVLLAENSDRR